MKYSGKQALWAGLALAAIVVVAGWGWRTHTQRGIQEMTQTLQTQMTTHCVGRFLIDLPKDVRIKHWEAGFEGAGQIVTSTISLRDFTENVNRRATALANQKHMEGGIQLERSVEPALENTRILFFWESEFYKGKLLKSEVYHWRDGEQFFISSIIKKERIEAASSNYERFLRTRLRPRAPDEIPTEPGFCIDHGFIAGAPGPEHSERVEFQFELADHPDVQLRLGTMVAAKVGDSLLQRNEDNEIGKQYASRIKTLRARDRSVGPIKGQELVERIREFNGIEILTLQWESFLTPQSSYEPEISFEMKTGWAPPDEVVKPSLSDARALALWDAMLNTIRLRPTTPPKTGETIPPRPDGSAGLPLGTQVSSRYSCPQSGIWECAADLNIDGPKQRFIEAFQPLPHGFAIEPAAGLKGKLGAKRRETREITWTLVAYEETEK